MSSTTAATVAPVHGGLSQPVNRLLPRERVLFPAWNKFPAVQVNGTDRTTLYRIADGTLSPLLGPMGKDDYQSVLDRCAIERDGKLWAWTIPIVLPVTDEEAAACEVGNRDRPALRRRGLRQARGRRQSSTGTKPSSPPRSTAPSARTTPARACGPRTPARSSSAAEITARFLQRRAALRRAGDVARPDAPSHRAEGLRADDRLPDAQPAAPRARVRARLRRREPSCARPRARPVSS